MKLGDLLMTIVLVMHLANEAISNLINLLVYINFNVGEDVGSIIIVN
jgi:hypothetical protein